MRRSSAPLTELCNKRGMSMAPTRERNAAPKRSCRHRLHGRGQVKFKRINDTFNHAEGAVCCEQWRRPSPGDA
jgi:GGDEF domain-containing protein